MQMLDPLALVKVGAFAGHILHVAWIDQTGPDAVLFQHVVHRNSVDASGFHRRRGDAAMDQPFGHLVKIAGEGLALANRMVIPVRRYGNINLPSSNIDARSTRFKQRRLDLLALTAPFTMNHLRFGFIRRWLLWLMLYVSFVRADGQAAPGSLPLFSGPSVEWPRKAG